MPRVRRPVTAYDALVSINVPTDKAKAVIDAMEREMMDKVATMADLDQVRDLMSKELKAIEGEFKLVRQEIAPMGASLTKDFQIQIAGLENRLTTRLGTMMAGMVGAVTPIAGAITCFR
mgnify:CR=1 FL=1